MDYFAGLDVSVKETSVCIVDDAGKIVRECDRRKSSST
jgi:transposase